jgi:uncharacterized protein (DUF305 family)
MTSAPQTGDASSASTRRLVGIAAIALTVVIAVCAGALIGNRLAGDQPSTDSVEAGFARDMQVHHAQAVEMSYAVTLATDDDEVRQIAFDILTSQQGQIGRMAGWLVDWDLSPHSPEPVMAWMSSDAGDGHDMEGMDHSGDGDDTAEDDGALMPGMATDAEMQQLRESSGRRAEILFLQLMVDHHRGGVDMAAYAAEHASDDEVALFADQVATGQAADIRAMNDMLVERGAEPA